ncbi:MAG: B12-binding domain-containing radical SAM protein, partial [Candidatus Odinarchaeia archaeon]
EFELINSQGYRQILISYDHFFMKPKRTIKILRGLRKRKIDMDIICESRVDFAKKDVLTEANKSGVKAIFYGMESGSERILEYYRKKITVSQIKEAVRKTREAKINMIVGSFMYGAPYESLNDMLKTSHLILSLDLDVIILNIVDVLPGTELWFEAERMGILPPNSWRKTIHAADIFPNSIPVYKIKKIIDKTYELFLKRKHWIFKQLLRTINNKWRLNLLYSNIRKMGLGNIKQVINEVVSSNRMYKYQDKISI